MAKSTNNESRIDIPYFNGVNSTVQDNLAQKNELSHIENARAPLIGVLEKREGFTKAGTKTDGTAFTTQANYGLGQLNLPDTASPVYQGVFRVSATDEYSAPSSSAGGDFGTSGFNIQVYESVTVSEPVMKGLTDGNTLVITAPTYYASIFGLTSTNTWNSVVGSIIGSNYHFTTVDGQLFMVNGEDYNRYLGPSGTSVAVVDSTSNGHLYNSPRAKKIAFYKNRIYLANYKRDNIQYKTNVIRSSYPLGIVALVDGDFTAHASGSAINVTDTKYIYSTTGNNSYDIYRGGTLITNITVTTVNETSIVATHTGVLDILSSDEIWIAGTFNGAKKYRWINNPTATGKDVKQYDTFKLSGGSEDEITLFEGIGNVLLIGNKNTLATWNDYTLENFDLGVGCCSTRGSVKLMGTLFFLHYSGVYATTGSTPTLISRKIDRYIKGATKSGLESSAAGFKGLSVFFTVGDVTLYNEDGSTWKTMYDVCLEYNIADKNWYVHTNVPVDAFLNFINSSGDERLLATHTDAGNYVKEFLDGTTDDGSEIFFRVDTNPIQLMSDLEKFAQPLRVITDMDRGSLVTTMVSCDGEDFYEIDGTNKKGVSILKVTSRNKSITQPSPCRKIKLSFRDSSKQLCRLTAASIIYLPTAIEEQRE